MLERGWAGVRNPHPATLIVGVVAIKAIVLFTVVAILPRWIGSYYGIEFSDNYDWLAWNLSSGNGYRFTADTAPTLMREPGYPLVLAGLFSLFGKSLDAARCLNLLLAGVAAWLIYVLANRLFAGRAVGLIAALLFLIHPGILVAELRGGVEILFIVAILGAVGALCIAVQSGRCRDYFLAGLALGAASLVRSTPLLFPAFLIVYFCFRKEARPAWKAVFGRIALVWIGALIVLSPWMIRNWFAVGVPLPTASVQGIAAHAGQYICSHRTLHSNLRDLDFDAARARAVFATQLGLHFKPGGYYYQHFYDTHDELVFSNALSALVVDNYRRSPALLFKCPAMNVFNFWFAGKNWTSTGLNMAVQLPYLILGIFGIVAVVRSGRLNLAAIPLLFMIYLMLVHLPVHSQARYSVPLLPFLSMFAAAGLLSLMARFRAGVAPAGIKA